MVETSPSSSAHARHAVRLYVPIRIRAVHIVQRTPAMTQEQWIRDMKAIRSSPKLSTLVSPSAGPSQAQAERCGAPLFEQCTEQPE